jgi:hypothetical protein
MRAPDQHVAPKVEYQLRHYKIREGTMDRFLDAWLKGVYPLRQRFGFTFVGAWVNDERSEFVWIIGYDGADGVEAADHRYYDSPERKAMDPDPAKYIGPGGVKLALRNVLPR